MRVGEIMTRDVKSCRPDDDLDVAARIMWDEDCGCVPVIENGRHVVGIITDRDICMAAYTKGRPLAEITVESAMARQIFTCHPGDSIEDAERTMRCWQVRRLPVIDLEARLVGILSLNDLARFATPTAGSGLSALAIEETLAAVCAARRPPLSPTA